MLDGLLLFLFLPHIAITLLVVFAILALISIETENWFWATVVHAASIWFAFEAFELPFEWSSLAVFVVAYFVIGALTSLLKWLYLVRRMKDVLVTSTKKSLPEIKKYWATQTSRTPQPVSGNSVQMTDEMYISWFLNLKDDDSNDDADEDLYTNLQLRQSVIAKSIFDRAYETPRYVGSYGLDSAHMLVERMKPDAGKYKSNIVGWIVFWPTVFIWTVLNNPIKRIGTWIYEQFGTTYSKIANSIFKF